MPQISYKSIVHQYCYLEGPLDSFGWSPDSQYCLQDSSIEYIGGYTRALSSAYPTTSRHFVRVCTTWRIWTTSTIPCWRNMIVWSRRLIAACLKWLFTPNHNFYLVVIWRFIFEIFYEFCNIITRSIIDTTEERDHIYPFSSSIIYRPKLNAF